MRYRWCFSAGLTLVFIVLGTLWLFEPAPEQPVTPPQQPLAPETVAQTNMYWRVGTSQQYQLRSASSMKMSTDAATAPGLSVHLQAELELITLESATGEALAGMQLSSVDLKISGHSDPATNQALSAPFRVRFTSGGYPTAFEFPAETSAKNRSILENLMRMFQVTNATGENWVAQESNSSGSYEAVYRRINESLIEKTKRQFKAQAFAEMFEGAVIESTETIRLDPDQDWITGMTIDEKLASKGQGGPAMTIINQASIELQSSRPDPVISDQWQFAATEPSAESLSSKQPVPKISKQQAKAKILAAVPELDATQQGRTTWIHQLRDLLRVDDAMPAALLDVLKADKISDRTRADLYLALELAGTESAQRALISVINEPEWAIPDALRAIVALGSVKQPSSDTITALWDTVSGASSGGERERLGSPATFALGRLGHALNAANDPNYPSLRSNLIDGTLSGVDDRQRANFVHAVGNTRDATLSENIVGLLNDNSPRIRRAAAQSLGVLGTNQAADELIARFRQESNSEVRGAIAASLVTWTTPTVDANSIIATAVEEEKSPNARYNMARFLGENLSKFPQNRVLLENMLRHEQAKRIRQYIANALAAAD